MKQAPLYGSSAENPSRPPVSIEDHWSMAGLKQNAATQSRQQRAVSASNAPVPVYRELSRPADSIPMPVSHSDEANMPFGKSSRTLETRDSAVSSKSILQPAPARQLDPSNPDAFSALNTVRIAETAPLRAAASNGTANLKTFGSLGTSVFASNSRRRASAPIDNATAFGSENNGLGLTPKPSWDSGVGKGSKKSENAAPGRYPLDGLDIRKMSIDADQTPTPSSTGSGSAPTSLATVHHKSRWGDGLKSAMRLGKSKT
jgi:hypothetical protein